jgi:hypothetical protein
MVVPLSMQMASPGSKTEMSPGLSPSSTDISPMDECGYCSVQLLPLNAAPRTLCDNDISNMWCLGSRSSTVVLGD